MSDILSRIQILLDADTARFEQGMRDAEESSGSSFKKIRESANTMGLMVVGAATTAMGSMFAMAGAFAEQAQQIEINAYKAQATTAEFQKMAVGAKQVGIETDELADIYKDFNEKLGEMISVGGGGGVDFFDQVALKTEGSAEGAMKLAKSMAELSGPQAMQLYVDKMQEANLSQDQMSFLMESMGSEATMLLPLLKNGGEGFKLWGDAAERAGAIMSEEAIAKSAEFRVQSRLLQLQLEGAKNQLAQSITPAFVDIANAFFDGTEKGIQFADFANGLTTVLKFLAKVGLGVASVFQTVGQAIGAAMASAQVISNDVGALGLTPMGLTYAAAKNASQLKGIWAEARTDISDSWLGMAERFEKIDGGKASEAVSKMSGILRESTKQQAAATAGSKEWIDSKNEEVKVANSTAQAQSKLNEAYEQQAQARKQIEYQYVDRLKQIQLDLDSEIDRIEAAKFSRSDQDGLVAAAIFRAQTERDLYIAEQQFEINAHRYTEEQKLAEEFKINQLRINATADLHEDMKQASLIASNERYQQEMAWMRLEKAQAESDAGSMLRTDLQNMEIKYTFERDQILLNSKLSGDEQKRRIALSLASEEFTKRQNLNDASMNWGSTQADMAGTRDQYQLDQTRFSRYDESQALFDAQMALADSAAEREAIWQAHNDRMLLIDQDYEKTKLQLGAQSAADTLSSMTDLMGDLLGEQSAGYKAMFVLQKGAALAKVIMNAPETFSNVYNSVSAIPLIGPYIAPVLASGALAVQLAQAAQIKSMSLDGMAHEGFDNIPNEGTWLLDKGERVLSPRQNADLTRYLDDQKQGNGNATNVIINVPSGYTANESRDANGNVTIDVVRQEIASSWNNLRRSNSHESRSVQQSFGLAPVR